MAVGSPSVTMAPDAVEFGGGKRQGGTPMSMLGALLVSMAVVAMTVLGLCFLAGLLAGLWWLVSHIPVPMAVWHLLQLLGLSA